jgi:sRNA-binding regulator protein Hfq
VETEKNRTLQEHFLTRQKNNQNPLSVTLMRVEIS